MKIIAVEEKLFDIITDTSLHRSEIFKHLGNLVLSAEQSCTKADKALLLMHVELFPIHSISRPVRWHGSRSRQIRGLGG